MLIRLAWAFLFPLKPQRLMAKSKITIKKSDLSKLHKAIKKLEKDSDRRIRGYKASGFLIAATDFESAEADVPLEVKTIILHVAGDFDTDPETLKDKINLTVNLLYDEDEFSILAMRLDRLVKKHNKEEEVTDEEVNECKTVGDVLKMVNEKIAP